MLCYIENVIKLKNNTWEEIYKILVSEKGIFIVCV